MIRDWTDVALVGVIISGLCAIVFILLMTNKFDECEKRGGTPVDTKRGWVCAKIERV